MLNWEDEYVQHRLYFSIVIMSMLPCCSVVMLCLDQFTSTPVVSFWFIPIFHSFILLYLSPQYPLTSFIASNTCRFSRAPTSERTNCPPSTAPQATTDRDMSDHQADRTNVVASIRKHTYEAFEDGGVPCWAQRQRNGCTEKGHKNGVFVNGRKKLWRNKLYDTIKNDFSSVKSRNRSWIHTNEIIQ